MGRPLLPGCLYNGIHEFETLLHNVSRDEEMLHIAMLSKLKSVHMGSIQDFAAEWLGHFIQATPPCHGIEMTTLGHGCLILTAACRC